MEVNEDTFLDYFNNFYPNFIPIMLFVLCYLLFKNKPNKWAYVHLFVVIFIVIFKHWATMLDTIFQAYELDVDINEKYILYDYINHAFFTALSAIVILALLHRNNGAGYDTLLKKEIWGVWAKENNTSDYFDARERKLRTQGIKDDE